MYWKKPTSRYYIESVCRSYTISKSVVLGKVKYQAWHIVRVDKINHSKPDSAYQSAMPKNIGIFETADIAKQACEKHKAGNK